MRNIFTLEFYTHCKTGVITLAKSFFYKSGWMGMQSNSFSQNLSYRIGSGTYSLINLHMLLDCYVSGNSQYPA